MSDGRLNMEARLRAERARDKRGGGMLDGVRMFRHAIQVVSSTDGRDRWLLVRRNTIIRAWSAPKWLSPVSWAWKRSPQAKQKRGGC